MCEKKIQSATSFYFKVPPPPPSPYPPLAGIKWPNFGQAAVKAGLPHSVPAFGLNMVCGSGLRAVALAAQVKTACQRQLL